MNLQNQKIAIVVSKYFHSEQTFVNRHIRELYNGNSCIIAERRNETPDSVHKRPCFILREEITDIKDYLYLPYFFVKNWFNFRDIRIPQGLTRKKMIAFIKEQDVTVILSEFGSQSLLITEIGRELDLPVFCYFRGRDATERLKSKTRVKAYKKVFENLAGVFAVSQFLLDNLASVGITHPNAHVVPSGTDIDQFQPGKKDPNLVLAVGRFVGKKYPELTIRAFAEASKTHPNARLEMIGGGPALKSCQALVADLGLDQAITLHGKKDNAFVASRLFEASIFAQHSVTDKTGEAEGLPSSIQEAMAAGCAILSTRHAGIPELVENGETGYLCDELDFDGYTQNLITMLGDPKALANMSANARKIAETRIDYRILYAKVESVIRASL